MGGSPVCSEDYSPVPPVLMQMVHSLEEQLVYFCSVTVRSSASERNPGSRRLDSEITGLVLPSRPVLVWRRKKRREDDVRRSGRKTEDSTSKKGKGGKMVLKEREEVWQGKKAEVTKRNEGKK